MSWDRVALESALASAKDASSTDVVIVHHGEVVVDEAWEPAGTAVAQVVDRLDGVRVSQDIASAQKAITSVLLGISVARNLVRLDDLVTDHLGPGWAGPKAPPTEPRITVRHLITMTSGLADDMSFLAEPGVQWDYNLGAGYHLTKRVIAHAAGLELNDLTTEWLTGPLLMTESYWLDREWQDGIAEIFRFAFEYPHDRSPIEAFVSTARDLAKFGEAVRRGCSGLGVDEGYAAAMVQTSQPLNPAYGYLWWLNGKDSFVPPKAAQGVAGPFLPGVPSDAFAALGAMDRLCVIVPSLELVVTRCGGQAAERSPAGSVFVREFTAAVCAACP